MKKRRRWGDRADGTWIRDVDSMHAIMPHMHPNRCDNEAFIQERIDATNILKYLENKNKNVNGEPYKIFHVMLSAVMMTMIKRPKMNIFVQGRRMYMKNDLTCAFVVKKQMNEKAQEALAFLTFPQDTTIDMVYSMLNKEIKSCKKEDVTDAGTAALDLFAKIPRWLMMIVMPIVHLLDFYGKMPKDIVKGDPNYASVFLSNLGSIKLNAGYHHLANRGTNSIFVVIGELHKAQIIDKEGNAEIKDVINIGLTLDERIADGYYYAKTIKVLKEYLENPELLEKVI